MTDLRDVTLAVESRTDLMSLVMMRGVGKRKAIETDCIGFSAPPVAKIPKLSDSYDEPDALAVELKDAMQSSLQAHESLLSCFDERAEKGPSTDNIEREKDAVVSPGIEKLSDDADGGVNEDARDCDIGQNSDKSCSTGILVHANDDREQVIETLAEQNTVNDTGQRNVKEITTGVSVKSNLLKTLSKSRVGVFNESASNGDISTQFAITPFQGLNSGSATTKKHNAKHDLDEDLSNGLNEARDRSDNLCWVGKLKKKRDINETVSMLDQDNHDGSACRIVSDTIQNLTESYLETDSEDSKMLSKDDAKKASRKQNNPKRLPLPKDFASTSGNNCGDGHRDLPKSEKSRKQFKPQRIVQTFGHHCDSEVKEEDPVSNVDIDNVIDDQVGEPYQSKIKTDLVANDFSDESILSENQIEIERKDEEDTYYSALAQELGLNSSTTSQIDISEMYRNIAQLHGVLPHTSGKFGVLDKTALQNEIMVNLTQNLFQSQIPSSSKESASENKIEENLDVVRKLREIRFHRYRKITISEKKEIADYAKVNGVSAAAAHYGVSKSAVSMWTRTDFTDMDDESKKRKKNCLIGNEKFEELVLRVKAERASKFKGLSKQDKSEVSKYAKLVGVREMSRCLDVALGTVSGWMRQFPYTLESSVPDDVKENENEEDKHFSEPVDMGSHCGDEKIEEEGVDTNENSEVSCSDNRLLPGQNKIKQTPEVTNQVETPKRSQGRICKREILKQKNKEATFTEQYCDKQKDTCFDEERLANEHSHTSCHSDTGLINDVDKSNKLTDESKDDVDKLIAENLQQPDVDKCFENVQDMIYGTPLQDDKDFEQLFRRVIVCRNDKYKNLKASEKLEVVRYAKQNGVRKMAKILGLATGTLSGWNTKYQNHLNLSLDDSSMSLDGISASHIEQESSMSSSGTFLISEKFGNVNVSDTQSPSMLSKGPELHVRDSTSASANKIASTAAILDNPEKSEVLAIKYLMKDRFEVLVKKIEIARKIKFRNISREEKVEIVKCAKLVGIRPTARVLNMPIGTLSGWITKYSNELHPVYHVSQDDESAISVPDKLTALANISPLLTSNYAGLMSPINPALSQIHRGLSALPSTPFSNSANFELTIPGRFGSSGNGIVETPQEMRHYAELLKAFSETSVNFSELAKQKTDSVDSDGLNVCADGSLGERDLENDRVKSRNHKEKTLNDFKDPSNHEADEDSEGDDVSHNDSPSFEKKAEYLARQYITASYEGLDFISPTGV